MKYEDLRNIVVEDLKIDRYKLAEESLRTPAILVRHLDFYHEEKKTLHQLTGKMNILRKEKRLYYSGKADPAVYEDKPFDLKILKQELDLYIDYDEDVINLTYKISMQKEKCFYLEKVIKGIEQREFSVKNAITVIQYEGGI